MLWVALSILICISYSTVFSSSLLSFIHLFISSATGSGNEWYECLVLSHCHCSLCCVQHLPSPLWVTKVINSMIDWWCCITDWCWNMNNDCAVDYIMLDTFFPLPIIMAVGPEDRVSNCYAVVSWEAFNQALLYWLSFVMATISGKIQASSNSLQQVQRNINIGQPESHQFASNQIR